MSILKANACPDCSGKLTEIALIAEGNDIHYGIISGPRPFFGWKTAGAIKAYRCDSCTRVFLYGQQLE